MAYNISKYYRNILGLDLRVSDLLRSSSAATEAVNIAYRQTGALSKRTGFQIKTPKGNGGAGLVKFNNIELGTGIITEDLLCMDDDLKIYTEQTFTITYAGSTTAYFDFYLDATLSSFQFNMYEDNVIVLAVDVGDGKGASDETMAQLKVLVDAVTDFSMVITDAGNVPAAFSPIGRNVNITSSGTATSYFTWETVDTPGTYSTPFTNHWAT